jgi:hypothetical protein
MSEAISGFDLAPRNATPHVASLMGATSFAVRGMAFMTIP